MTPKLNAAQRKRMVALAIPLSSLPGSRAGVILMPPIEADHDAWSERAIASQNQLARLTRQGVEVPQPGDEDSEGTTSSRSP